MTLTTNKRNETADLLKGIAVFFMIQVHIMEQFTNNNVYNSAVGKISLFLGGPICAPIFLAVMGYFLVSESRSFWYYLKRGVILIIGGLLLNIFRSFHLLLYIIGEEVTYKSSFFIFGVDIFLLAGLSIIIIGILRLIFKKNYIIYFILALIIPVITPILPVFGINNNTSLQYVNAFLWGNYEWSYFPLFPWSAYVIIGYAYRLLTNKHKEFANIEKPGYYIALVPIIIVLSATIKYGVNTAHDDLHGYLGYYHHGISYFVWVVLFLSIYLIIIKFVEKYTLNSFIVKFIRWAGRNVTAVYVIQWLIIGNIATIIYKTQNIYQNIMWFVVITTVTCLITWAWTKIIDCRNKKEESII